MFIRNYILSIWTKKMLRSVNLDALRNPTLANLLNTIQLLTSTKNVSFENVKASKLSLIQVTVDQSNRQGELFPRSDFSF